MPEGPVVETALGRVQGVRADGLDAFRGIPFAAPPTGALRFRAPRPPESWTGVRDATRFGPSAPQAKVEFDLIPGLDVGAQGEDCLFVNVYTPAADAGRRPVMVWIHGGAFTTGSGSQAMYDFRPLVRRGDVVVVTLNYRLGAFGFLHLGDLADGAPECEPNAGILDQVAALAWVRENAAAFGGDPSVVTVFGESAGGMSVGTLLGLPAARGLFDRAIPQSGAAHGVNDREQATRVAAMLLEELGLARGGAAALATLPVDAIVSAQAACTKRVARMPRLRDFCPVTGVASLPQPPIEAIRSGLSRDVPVMVGATRDEWRLFGFMDPESRALDEAALRERIEARVPGHGGRLVEAYRAARPGAEPSDLFFAIETDRVFRIPCLRLAEAQAAHQPDTWSYLVTWESPLMDGALGACHGIDMPFVLGAIGTQAGDLFAGGGPEAAALSERMMGAWLAFARDGAPDHAGLPAWPRHDARRRSSMLFGRRCEAADDPFGAERRTWDGIL